jgi:hypothetical protein
MMTDSRFDFLLTDQKKNYEFYLQHWIDSTYKRPHDHPVFMEMMKPENYSSAVAIYHPTEKSKIIYPFFYCQLNELPEFSSIDTPLIHLQTPYGYGGPLYEGEEDCLETVSNEFEILFQKELSYKGIVSEFVREDIFTKRLAKRTAGKSIEQQLNVVVRLDRPDDEIWNTYKAKVRKNVNKAKSYNLEVVFDSDGYYLDNFINIYYETMKRTEASKFFFLPKEKIQNLIHTLGKENGLIFVHVFDGSDMVSTELLLLSTDTIYSFLGGTLTSSFHKRPNDLLKHEVINWGKKNGYKWFVLGGGATPGDGIFKYKEAFDPESIFSFSVRNVIHNQKLYGHLIHKRNEYERAQGNCWQPKPDFFPEFLS